MPVNFLSKAKQELYGRYAQPPTESQLSRYFHLDDVDRHYIGQRRYAHNRLGFALQVTTVRFLGTFLEDPIDVPVNTIAYLAHQLGMTSMPNLMPYRENKDRWNHTKLIRTIYGYRNFHEPLAQFQLLRWLYPRVWYTAERPSILFDRTTDWLIEQKILLPGATVLARLIARIRERAAQRLYHHLARLPNQQQYFQLEKLLDRHETTEQTVLDVLRKPPARVSGPALVEVLQRIDAIREFEVQSLDLTHLPSSRLEALAQYARVATAETLRNLQSERRIATLLAFIYTLEAIAQDEALDLFDQLMRDIFKKAVKSGEKQRLHTLKDLDEAARRLSVVGEVLLDQYYTDTELRRVIFSQITPQQLAQAIQIVHELTRPPDSNYYERLVNHYRSVRRYLPRLLQTITFSGLPNTRPLLEALTFLRDLDGGRVRLQDAPRLLILTIWQSLVFDKNNQIRRDFYTFCTLKQLHDALQRRDVFIAPSYRWRDPRAKLFQGASWGKIRPQVCRVLDLPVSGNQAMQLLHTQLDVAYRLTLQNWESNDKVRIEKTALKARLIVTGLDRLDLPSSYDVLRDQAYRRLPRLDLPEVMLEIQARTGFADEFFHVSESQTLMADFSISICAVLLAEACNIGLEPLVHPHHPALSLGRLRWVQQNFIRAETLSRANARLVDIQAQIPLARVWGGGEVASADGLRFLVPVSTAHAESNPHYFGMGRGVTYLNFTSDQFTGFHGIVIPGAVREALYVLDGLLEQESSLVPLELMTDTAGYTDVIFGLFWLLGFRFSPRIADIGSTRFWRIDRQADYGALNALAQHRIQSNRITQHWDDLLRIAGSLKFGRLSASELMRTFRIKPRASSLTLAVRELGRIAKTIHLMAYIRDEAYRRRILRQLNRTETRHRLARAIFHGQQGQLRQPYRRGQEEQLGALGLVTNIVVLWNTLYLDAVLDQLRREAYEVLSDDVSHLSPLGFEHINFLGRYEFTLAQTVQQGNLRPLRDPNTLNL